MNYLDKRFQEAYTAMTPVLSVDAYYQRLLDIAIEGKKNLFASEPDLEKRAELHAKAFRGLFWQFLNDDQKDIKAGSPPVVAKGLDFLRRLLGPSGPYEGQVPGGYSCLDFDEIPRYAYLAHLAIKEPETFGYLRPTVFDSLIHHQLESAGRFKALSKALNKLCQLEPTLPLDDVMSDIEANIHDHLTSYVTMAKYQEQGGLARLLEKGADIKAMLHSCLDIVEGTEAKDKSFASMFRLTLDCINHLEAQEGITPEEASANRSQLLRNALEVSGRQKNKDPGVWSPMIRELAGAADESLTPRDFLSYVYYLTPEEYDQNAIKLMAKGDPERFKQYLKRDYLQSGRYAFIHKAGIQNLFTENEILTMCGHQFAADLGL
jgi:hypothetical protein